MILAGLLALGLGLSAQETTSRGERPRIVVGTFDSRAVWVAHVHSAAFKERTRELRKELDEAQAAGDKKRVSELEALGPAMQKRIHQQAFGTAPVDDIIKLIEDKLGDLAAKAGVDVIVSRWALAYQGPGAEFVDVTDLLVRAFDPDDATLELVERMRGTDPVPAEELEGHEDR